MAKHGTKAINTIAKHGKTVVKVGGKVLGPVSNAVAPGVAFAKGVAKPANSLSERLTNGIVAGAKKTDNAAVSFAGAWTGTKIAGSAGTVVGGPAVGIVSGIAGGIYGGAKASSKYDGSAADKAFDKKIEKNRGAIQANVEKKINAVKNVGKNIKTFFLKAKRLLAVEIGKRTKRSGDLQKQKKRTQKSYPKRSGPPVKRTKPKKEDTKIVVTAVKNFFKGTTGSRNRSGRNQKKKTQKSYLNEVDHQVEADETKKRRHKSHILNEVDHRVEADETKKRRHKSHILNEVDHRV